MAARASRKIQIGLETTAGTAVAATRILRGQSDGILDASQVMEKSEDVGYLSGVDDTYMASKAASLSYTAEATFEEMPYLLTCGILKDEAGAADGSGYIYTYGMPTTSALSISYATIEAGDSQQAYEMEYAFVDQLSISGAASQAISVTADWIGRQKSSCSFTTLSLADVEEIIFNKAKLYIDAVSGTIGTTQVACTFLGFNLDIDTGRKEKFTGDGNLYYTCEGATAPRVTGSITFEYDSTGVARETDFAAETARLFRIECQGSALTTAGSNYGYKTLRIDMAAKSESVSVLGDDDGNDTVTINFVSKYNRTASKFCDIVVVNENATL